MTGLSWYKKGLVVGIIILFIGVGVHPAIGNGGSRSKSNDDLPDYIITKVDKGYDACVDGIYYYIVIKNIGDKEGGLGYTVYIDEYKANFFKPDEKYNNWVVGESNPYGLKPGESRYMRFSWGFFDEHPWFLRYECTLTCDFHEKNSDNNYFEKTYFNGIFFLLPLPFFFNY